MRRGLVLLMAASALVAACGPAGSARLGGAGVTPVPAPAALSPRAPSTAALTTADVGLPVLSAADGVTAARAANAEPDAADALALFDSWGWVSESERRFGAGSSSVDDLVLLTLTARGAQSAFAFFSEQAGAPPLARTACPASISGLDQCVLGVAAGRAVVVGRYGTEVFQMAFRGVDGVRLGALQADRLRA